MCPAGELRASSRVLDAPEKHVENLGETIVRAHDRIIERRGAGRLTGFALSAAGADALAQDAPLEAKTAAAARRRQHVRAHEQGPHQRHPEEHVAENGHEGHAPDIGGETSGFSGR